MSIFGSVDDPPILVIGNCVSKIINIEREALFKLDSALAVEVPGAQYAMRFKPNWDGKWHPLNLIAGTFPTGLTGMVRKLLPMAVIEDKRVRPHTLPLNRNVLTMPLRDYQFQALQAVFAMDRGVLSGRGVVGLPMAAGKTLTGLAIAVHVVGKCVIIVHRKDLFHQWREEIKKITGVDAACIGDSGWDGNIGDPGTKFVLAMPQTAEKSIDEFRDSVKDAKIILIDECQRMGAATWYAVAQRVPAFFRIGLTGTVPDDPVKALRLKGTTGNLLIKAGAAELADMGFLSHCTVIVHRVNNPACFGNWHTIKRQLIEDNSGRNEAIASITEEETQNGKRVLVFCDTIWHAKTIQSLLVARTIDVRLVTGKQQSQDRNAARADLKSGMLGVVVATDTWSEGVDLPALDIVVIAAGGKSSVKFTQRVGRALRRTPDKSVAIIHDFHDTGHRWVLNHSLQRQAIAKKEKFTTKTGRTIVGRPGPPPRSVVEDVDVHEAGGETTDVVEE